MKYLTLCFVDAVGDDLNSRASSFRLGETDLGKSTAELSNTELMTLEYFDRENQHKNGKNWA